MWTHARVRSPRQGWWVGVSSVMVISGLHVNNVSQDLWTEISKEDRPEAAPVSTPTPKKRKRKRAAAKAAPKHAEDKGEAEKAEDDDGLCEA